jgi:hypothetical protein
LLFPDILDKSRREFAGALEVTFQNGKCIRVSILLRETLVPFVLEDVLDLLLLPRVPKCEGYGKFQIGCGCQFATNPYLV